MSFAFMLNIVIPMSGLGSRFVNAGYADPKPLINIQGKPMIKWVIDNLTPNIDHKFFFICQKKHVAAYQLDQKLAEWSPGSALIQIDGLTEGAACTVLCAEEMINNNFPLMIANSDQYIDADLNDFIDDIKARQLDGSIMTMKANDPKWSFVQLNHDELVTRVVEKEVISDEATVGIYYFNRGDLFVSAAKKMIDRNERTNGEFYVAPVYNTLIEENARIGIKNIGSEANGMYGLGTPNDLNLFLSLPISKKYQDQQ
jgi:dTDP-glucose pyrophosphorylase